MYINLMKEKIFTLLLYIYIAKSFNLIITYAKSASILSDRLNLIK